jgi:hypothetical protein
MKRSSFTVSLRSQNANVHRATLRAINPIAFRCGFTSPPYEDFDASVHMVFLRTHSSFHWEKCVDQNSDR